MKLFSFIIGAAALISAVTAAPAYEVHGEDVCGPKYGKCDKNECCSKYGYCGKSSDHCDISKGCQSEFGICNGEVKAMAAKETSVETSREVSEKTSEKSVTTIEKAEGNVEYAGFRYSIYGIKDSFNYVPDSDDIEDYVGIMKDQFYKGTKGVVFLIVGVDSKSKKVVFQFPKPSNQYSSEYYKNLKNIEFIDSDRYESFLDKCDEKGYHVWLQVEPGENDLVQLAHITMDRYGHHSSVRGFGIDCEWWYRKYTDSENGRPLTDEVAEKVVKAVRKRNSTYTVYAKHWKPSYMPKSYRDGMIFVNDSQGFSSLSKMEKEFKEWAQTYPNNPVFFQIGYKKDRSVWKNDPVGVAKSIADAVSKYNDEIGIVWVDFTMKQAIDSI
jgi:hypothetical protein